MTNRNSGWRTKPFLLKPAGKDYLWGGSRLKGEFGKQLPMEPLAETWECSTHPEGPSIIADGEFRGRTLSEVVREHPEVLGTHPRMKGELPILIKFIDADKDLSVQVHPDDKYAGEKENGALGKTEMWYVLDAAQDASLVYGFRHDMTKEALRESLQNGTVEKHLQRVRVCKDDVFYIEAGTVHALGAGVLVAEIQENSNLTYRMYDYNRVDKNGNPRKLHAEKALEVVNLKGSEEPRQPMRVLRYQPGCALELLCRCRYFQVERLLMNTKSAGNHSKVPFQTGSNSFQVLLCVEGSGRLKDADKDENREQEEGEGTPEGADIRFRKGDCIFIPADSLPLALTGSAQLLKVSC